MEENENILEKAVRALKNEQVPPGPSQELADVTVAKLTEASGQSNNVTTGKRIWFIDWLKATNSFTKVAAAAVLLIIAGYATGRLTSPQPPDIKQLQAALEPVIRNRLLGEMKQYWQLTLTSSYAQLKNELSQQYRSDLNQFAAYTLAASGAATNQLFEELIDSINEAQTHDRQWFTSAIEQIELNRLRDNAQLTNAFATFAVQTEDELQGMARILSYTQPGSSVPNESENPNNLN
jgi:predicted DNA-binding ribbon-helix-helix protein